MKSLFASILVLAVTSGVAYAQSAPGGEIGYAKGALGYDALVAGDSERAIKQILSNDEFSRHDPARLINLGQAYVRTGRTSEAERLFTHAIQSRDEVDLILADGRVMSSKVVARQALSSLQSRVATR